jgi:hypothetical protein
MALGRARPLAAPSAAGPANSGGDPGPGPGSARSPSHTRAAPRPGARAAAGQQLRRRGAAPPRATRPGIENPELLVGDAVALVSYSW